MKMRKVFPINSHFKEQAQASYQLQHQITQATLKRQQMCKYKLPLSFKAIILQQIWLKHSKKSFIHQKQSFNKQILSKQKILKHEYFLRWQFKIKSKQIIKSTLSDILCQQSASKGSFLYRLKGLIQRQQSLIKDKKQINEENTLKGAKNSNTQSSQYQSKKQQQLNQDIQNKQTQLQTVQLLQKQVEEQQIYKNKKQQQSQIIIKIGPNQNQQNLISLKQATQCQKRFLQQQNQNTKQISQSKVQQLDQKLMNKAKISKFLYKHKSMVQKLKYEMNDEFKKINSIINKIQVIAGTNKK